MRGERQIGRTSTLTVSAIDSTGDRSSGPGRTYRISSGGHGLELTVAEWRAIAMLVERDMARDAVPLSRHARRHAARRRKR